MNITEKLIRKTDVRIILIIASILAVAWLQAPRLADRFQVDEDFRSFYWMSKFQDPDLFPNQTAGYEIFSIFGLQLPLSPDSLGYGLLFYGASYLVSPATFSKIIPFLVMPVITLYLFAYGARVRGRLTGIVLALSFLFINLASSSAISVANGLQRSFALPLIVILIYYLNRRNYFSSAIVLVLCALIYPPAFALALAMWGIFIIQLNWPSRYKTLLKRGGAGFLITSLIVGTATLWPVLSPRLANLLNQSSTNLPIPETVVSDTTQELYDHLWEYPRFQPDGAAPLFIIFPIVGRGGIVDLGEDLVNLIILLIIGLLILLVLKYEALKLPPEVWSVLWASIIMFALSWTAIWLTDTFLLYIPSRYTRVGLFLFLFYFVFLNIAQFVKNGPAYLKEKSYRLFSLLIIVEIIALGLIILYPSKLATIRSLNMKWLLAIAAIVFGGLALTIIRKAPNDDINVPEKARPFRRKPLLITGIIISIVGWAIYAPLFTNVSYLNPPQAERAMLRYLETIPKDAQIAGTPCALDNILLFPQRQIAFSCEYYDRGIMDTNEINEALKAYYSDNYQSVYNFCNKYEIDYLVIDTEAYSEDYLTKGKIFFEPYNQAVLVAINKRDTFIMAELPHELKVFEADTLSVIPCDSLN